MSALKRRWILVLAAALLLGSSRLPAAEGRARRKAAAPEISAEARAAIDKAVRCMGGDEALAKVRSVRLQSKGVYRAGGMEMPFTTETTVQLPGRFLWKVDAGTFKAAVGIQGRIAWSQMSGPVARADGAYRDSLLDSPLHMGAMLVRPLLGLRRATITGGEAKTIAGATLRTITVSVRGRTPFSLTFREEGDGAHLSRLEGAVVHPDGRKGRYVSEFGKPKDFGGIAFPSVIETQSFAEEKPFERILEEITKIEWNPQIAEGAFALPAHGLELMKATVKTTAEAQGLAAIHEGPYDRMGEKIRRLMVSTEEAGAMAIGPIVATYLGDPATVEPAKLRTEIFVPVVPESTPKGKLPEGVSVKRMPPIEVAAMMVRGAYGNADVRALEALQAWIRANGYEASGHPRALYYHQPEVTVDEDETSEVQIPVRKK